MMRRGRDESQEAEEVGEGLLGVDVEPTMLEPPADVQHVAVQEIEALHVGGDVDRLREVDEPQPPLPPQQVVRRQVAVGDARRSDPAEARRSVAGRHRRVRRVTDGRSTAAGRPPPNSRRIRDRTRRRRSRPDTAPTLPVATGAASPRVRSRSIGPAGGACRRSTSARSLDGRVTCGTVGPLDTARRDGTSTLAARRALRAGPCA